MKEGPPGRAHGDALASRKSRAPQPEWSCEEKEAPGHAPGSLFENLSECRDRPATKKPAAC
jgi:hypothetical protein